MQQVNQQQRQQEVRENVRSILQQVRQTALEAGRDPQQVQVMAVTKTVAPELSTQPLQRASPCWRKQGTGAVRKV